MQLKPGLWIEGAYYVDFDNLGQLRIVGPNNHLHFGSVGVYRDQIDIKTVYTDNHELVLAGHFKSKQLFLHDPAIGHIQKVRHYTELPGRPTPSFAKVLSKHLDELSPNYIALEQHGGYEIAYKRLFQRHWYGIKIQLADDVEVHRLERRRGFNLKATKSDQIGFKLITDTDQHPQSSLTNVVLTQPLDTRPFGEAKPFIDRLLDQTAIEITHLVKNAKTSGYDYGTVFPRDWMESADLGEFDLEPAAIAYMYHKAFEYVNPQGLGWHENIVGEFEFEKHEEMHELASGLDDLIDRSSRIGSALRDLIDQVEETYVIRNMVDIEPRYILSLSDLLGRGMESTDLERLRRVARYVVLQAEINDLITFKKMPAMLRRHKHDEYFSAGNWRDSQQAYLKVHPVIAPYDVNVVFYPQALALIRQHSDLLNADQLQLDTLITKWSKVKNYYRFTNHDGTPAYALALYDVHRGKDGPTYKQFKINHLDEAYDMYYNQPPEDDVVSFCQRLLSSKYFFTPSGPTLVGRHDGYSTLQYHGRVIWTKQTAFVVAGLERQLRRRHFSEATQQLIKHTIEATAKANIEAMIKLQTAPELHYDKAGRPRLYNEQTDTEGTMNLVQLWSAVGARRIIRAYLDIKAETNDRKLSHRARRTSHK